MNVNINVSKKENDSSIFNFKTVNNVMPKEMITFIFSLFSYKDLVSSSCVSKSWNNFVIDFSRNNCRKEKKQILRIAKEVFLFNNLQFEKDMNEMLYVCKDNTIANYKNLPQMNNHIIECEDVFINSLTSLNRLKSKFKLTNVNDLDKLEHYFKYSDVYADLDKICTKSFSKSNLNHLITSIRSLIGLGNAEKTIYKINKMTRDYANISLVLLSNIVLDQGDINKAIAVINKKSNLSINSELVNKIDLKVIQKISRKLLELNRISEAINFVNTIKDRTLKAGAILELSLLLSKKGHQIQAIEILNNVLVDYYFLTEDNIKTLTLILNSLLEENEFDKVEKIVKEILVQKKQFTVIGEIAKTLYSKGMVDRAICCINNIPNKSLFNNDIKFKVLYRFSVDEYNQGEIEKSISIAISIFSKESRNEALKEIAIKLIESSNHNQAFEIIEKMDCIYIKEISLKFLFNKLIPSGRISQCMYSICKKI